MVFIAILLEGEGCLREGTHIRKYLFSWTEINFYYLELDSKGSSDCLLFLFILFVLFVLFVPLFVLFVWFRKKNFICFLLSNMFYKVKLFKRKTVLWKSFVWLDGRQREQFTISKETALRFKKPCQKTGSLHI